MLLNLIEENEKLKAELTEEQRKMIHTSLTYMCANSDDHGMYYLWWALDMGCREENELSQAEIESNDQRCEKLLQECINFFEN